MYSRSKYVEQRGGLDLDLSLGDADVWLDIIPDYTIQDVAENITRLDYALLKRSLTKHECGAFLLPRPIHMEETTAINPEELRRVITLLKATFTHLIIDISKNFGPLELAAMRASDSILLVGQLDLPCLRNVVRLLQFFDRQEGISDKVKVVINRLGLEETQISMTKAVETIGREIFWQLPNDYATMVESRNNGVPLITQVPKSKLTKSIQQLRKASTRGDHRDARRAEKEQKLFPVPVERFVQMTDLSFKRDDSAAEIAVGPAFCCEDQTPRIVDAPAKAGDLL